MRLSDSHLHVRPDKLVLVPFSHLARSAVLGKKPIPFAWNAPQFATEAAITVLRIDDMVKLEKGEDEMEE